jgi:hypothetical protein
MAKIVYKKVRRGKNKNHRVSLRVGLPAGQLQYGLYVFGHLSNWFDFVLIFNFMSVRGLVNGSPTISYNGLRLKKVGDFEVQTFFWKPHFKCKTNFH